MSRPATFSTERYLEAKRTVDDRALHAPTFEALSRRLRDREAVRLLDVGGGTGVMLRRLLDRDALPARVDYTAVDVDRDALAAGADALRDRAAAAGGEVADLDAPTGSDGDVPGERVAGLRATGERSVTARFRAAEAVPFVRATDRTYDLVVAAAFMDLVAVRPTLDVLLSVVPDGLAYFPITFDGVTDFRPVDDPGFQRDLLAAYHATMSGPDRSGPTAGRELLGAAAAATATAAAGGELLSAGGSDWIVHPRGGTYPADEAYFLHHVVHIVERAVDSLSADQVAAWADRRHDAIADGELIYLAHGIDALLRTGG